MGMYVNPGNQAFAEIAGSNYVDKTGLIGLINDRISSPGKLVCVSRPRRFGKSYAAKMLTAYYDCSCDSHGLFDDKKAAATDKYTRYLNQFNVINLDITGFVSSAQRQGIPLKEVPNRITEAVHRELRSLDPDWNQDDGLTQCLVRCVEKPGGKQFVFIIDEWDAVIREAKNDTLAQMRYLNMLRDWFKNSNFTPKVVAAAYMTGILPIKKDNSQSAISDFKEYPIISPGVFAEYAGFTEAEVKTCSERGQIDFEELKKWYDGYDLPRIGSIYNPYSVMCAVDESKCRSYWRRTSATESLKTYISMDFEGLQSIVAQLIAGERIAVNVDAFQNDLENFRSADDVLTLLVHLGYLTYHEDDATVQIPNEEVRMEYEDLWKIIRK